MLLVATIQAMTKKVLPYYRLYVNLSALLGVVWVACGLVGSMTLLTSAGAVLLALTGIYASIARPRK
jgi:hypothetical protein